MSSNNPGTERGSERMTLTRVEVSAAAVEQVDAIHRILRANRGDRSLFQQPVWWLRRHVDEFVTAIDDQLGIIGCAQLHWHRPDNAEILAVAVVPALHRSGVGARLIQHCIELAREREPRVLWLATAKPGYFDRFGFRRVSRWRLPVAVLLYKLWLIFHQPVARWLPALFGRHTFMQWTSDRAEPAA
jgi:amino-acid N-acetyltransferase